MRPKVPLVSNPAASACLGERLARAGSCPDGAVVAPICKAQGSRPTADASEHVNLGKAPEVGRVDVSDISLINFSISHMSGFNQLAQPRGGKRVNLVVIGPLAHHHSIPGPSASVTGQWIKCAVNPHSYSFHC